MIFSTYTIYTDSLALTLDHNHHISQSMISDLNAFLCLKVFLVQHPQVFFFAFFTLSGPLIEAFQDVLPYINMIKKEQKKANLQCMQWGQTKYYRVSCLGEHMANKANTMYRGACDL